MTGRRPNCCDPRRRRPLSHSDDWPRKESDTLEDTAGRRRRHDACDILVRIVYFLNDIPERECVLLNPLSAVARSVEYDARIEGERGRGPKLTRG